MLLAICSAIHIVCTGTRRQEEGLLRNKIEYCILKYTLNMSAVGLLGKD